MFKPAPAVIAVYGCCLPVWRTHGFPESASRANSAFKRYRGATNGAHSLEFCLFAHRTAKRDWTGEQLFE